MLIHSTRHAQWLSNSWLVADKTGGDAVLIDSGGPSAEIDAFISEHNLSLRHVLCTHHHYDHVANNAHYRQVHDCQICAHRNESSLLEHLSLHCTAAATKFYKYVTGCAWR